MKKTLVLLGVMLALFVFITSGAEAQTTAAKFKVGERVQTISAAPVFSTSANCRPIYGSDCYVSSRIGSQASGIAGTVTAGPISNQGSRWWSVNFDTRPIGWVTENYLKSSMIVAPIARTDLYDFGGGSTNASCPTGYNAVNTYEGGYRLNSDRTGFNDYPDMYVCIRNHTPGSTSLYDFGGMYGYDYISGVKTNYPNPFTNAQSCPFGFKTFAALGEVQGSTGGTVICYRDHVNSAPYYYFGGMGGYLPALTGFSSAPIRFLYWNAAERYFYATSTQSELPILSVGTTGNGKGEVSGGSISQCSTGAPGSVCVAANMGTTILTATPDLLSAFIGWSGGGCSGTGTCIVNGAANVTATFGYRPFVNAANGHTYYLLKGDTWQQVADKAASLGGYLTTINDSAENDWITSMLMNVSPGGPTLRYFWSVWIGLNDKVSEGTYEWVNGTLSNYRNWRTGEPTGGTAENYVSINGTGLSAGNTPGFWIDTNGSVNGGLGLVEVDTNAPASTLTISKSGVGTGGVTGTDGSTQLSCGSVCSVKIADGNTVTLIATPLNAGNNFIGWSGGGCTGTGECKVKVTANVTVIATFGLKPNFAVPGSAVNPANGHTYYLIRPTTFQNAEAQAVTMGGHLATINDVTEYNWILDTISSYTDLSSGLWIGLNAVASPGNYVWTSGSTAAYRNWYYGMPNSNNNAGVVMSANGGAPGWHTVASTWTAAGLIELERAGTNGVLNIIKSGSGGGTVSGNGDRISCGTSCSTSIIDGTSVILTATAAQGSLFTGWSGGGCTGTATCIPTLSGNTTVTANFSPSGTILVRRVDQWASYIPGSVAVAQIDSSGPDYNNPTQGSYPVGQHTAYATNRPGYDEYVAKCSYPISATNGTECSVVDMAGYTNVSSLCTVTLCSTPVTVVAGQVSKVIFRYMPSTVVTNPGTTIPVPVTLSVAKLGTGNGIVTGGQISCGSNCSTTVNSGTVVTLTATPSSGSTHIGWSGGGCIGTGTCTVTMNAPTTVTAVFKAATVTTPTPTPTQTSISVSKIGLGTVIGNGINCGPTCSTSVNTGTTIVLTATPDAGYVFAGWSGPCTVNSNTCTVTVDVTKSVLARFTRPLTTILPWTGPTSGSATVGTSFDYSLNWSSAGSMGQYWFAFVHFVKEDDSSVVYGDSFYPSPSTDSPSWNGSQIATRDSYTFPAGTPPGRYRVMAGLYNGIPRAQNLLTGDGVLTETPNQYRYQVGTITVSGGAVQGATSWNAWDIFKSAWKP